MKKYLIVLCIAPTLANYAMEYDWRSNFMSQEMIDAQIASKHRGEIQVGKPVRKKRKQSDRCKKFWETQNSVTIPQSESEEGVTVNMIDLTFPKENDLSDQNKDTQIQSSENLTKDEEIKEQNVEPAQTGANVQRSKCKYAARPRCACLLCPKSFTRPDFLRDHVVTHHINPQILFCNACQKQFAFSYIYFSHLEKVHRSDKKKYKPAIIDKLSVAFNIYTQWAAQYVSSPTKATLPVDNNADEIDDKRRPSVFEYCILCSTEFKKEEFRYHLARHINKRILNCPQCNAGICLYESLIRHISRYHDKLNLDAFKVDLEKQVDALFKIHLPRLNNVSTADCLKTLLTIEADTSDQVQDHQSPLNR